MYSTISEQYQFICDDENDLATIVDEHPEVKAGAVAWIPSGDDINRYMLGTDLETWYKIVLT